MELNNNRVIESKLVLRLTYSSSESRKPCASGVRRVENKFLEPNEWILFQLDENMLFASRWLRNG